MYSILYASRCIRKNVKEEDNAPYDIWLAKGLLHDSR